MNKKLLYVFAGILLLGVASALIVPYLSNTAHISMKVSSPMSVQFAQDGDFTDNLDLEDTTGLSSVNFQVKVSNLANNEIVSPNLVITLDNGKSTTTCEDLTSIKFIDTWCHGELDTTDSCPEQELYGVVPCDDSTGKAIFTIPANKYKVGQSTVYPVEFTLANVEPNTYQIDGIINVPTV